MGIWLEVRCDSWTADDCYSKQNIGPAGSSSPTVADLSVNLTRLKKRLKAEGWQLKKGEIICPSCQKSLNQA